MALYLTVSVLDKISIKKKLKHSMSANEDGGFKQRKTDVVLTNAWRPKLGDVLLGAWEWLLSDGKDIREKSEAMNPGICDVF